MGRGGHGWGGRGGFGHGFGHGFGWRGPGLGLALAGGAVVGAGAYGSPYEGYPPPGHVVLRSRPAGLVATLHSAAGLCDRGWTGPQDVRVIVFLFYEGRRYSSGRARVAVGGGAAPVWRGGGEVFLPLPPHADLARASVVAQIRCANTFVGDAVVGAATCESASAAADDQPRESAVAPQGRLTWTLSYVAGDAPTALTRAVPVGAPPPPRQVGYPVAVPAEPVYARAVYADDAPGAAPPPPAKTDDARPPPPGYYEEPARPPPPAYSGPSSEDF